MEIGQLTSLDEAASELLTTPEPGAVTDFAAVRLLEGPMKNTLNAWTHVVPALAKYAKYEGKRSLFGRDKGESAYQELIEKLRLVPLGLYSDGRLPIGANGDDCVREMIFSLVLFKGAYPNWMEAYSTAHRLFIGRRQEMVPILESLQRSVEAELL